MSSMRTFTLGRPLLVRFSTITRHQNSLPSNASIWRLGIVKSWRSDGYLRMMNRRYGWKLESGEYVFAFLERGTTVTCTCLGLGYGLAHKAMFVTDVKSRITLVRPPVASCDRDRI
ncbi:hypothetical protein BDZ89DRAFT_680691 [Hymenopellis radicata]|nr:hypothetical protein BDZ89DRAFT_680691 [Hymenopellis radicata]